MNTSQISRFRRTEVASAFIHQSLFCTLVVAVCCFVFALAPVSAQQFGRISPQYQRFEWQVVQSRSFDVYYHQGGAYLGQYAAATLEESFKSVQRTLGLSFTEKLDIIIYNSPNEASQTNARDILVPKGLQNVNDVQRNRIVVAFNGDWYEFKRSLTRELVHGVLNTVFHGIVMPPSVGGQFELPAWFSGGLAEFLSNDGMSAETDMALRDIILSDRFTSLNALEPTLRVPVGHAFFWYVGEKFGAGRIGELITRTRGLRSIESAFRSTFGLSLEGFSTIWRRDLKEMYNSDVAKYEDVEKIATRITDTDRDGSQMNADPVWSPMSDKSGDKLAYLAAQGASGSNAQWQVMVLFEGKPSDRNPQKRTERILGTGRDFEAERSLLRTGASLLSWKPDGTQLAAVVSGNGVDAIVLANPTSGVQQRLELGLENITGIAFAPDGKTIVLSASENESADIYQYDLAAKKLTKLTNDVFTESEPMWSPDGKMLYFLSNRLGTLTTNTSSASMAMWDYAVQSSDVYALTLATKRMERITNSPQERKIGLALTQDGKRLLFVSDRNGIYNTSDLTLATKTLTPRTSLLAGMREFGLTRDGAKMSFAALKKGTLNIFTLGMPLDRKIKEPEPTELRKQSLERESAAEKALGRAVTPSSGDGIINPTDGIIVQQTPDTLRGYGKVDLTFERQKMIEPNPEIIAQTARQTALEANDYSVPGKYPSVPMEYGLNLLTWVIIPSFDTFFDNAGVQNQQSLFGNVGLSAQALWADPLGNHRLFATANIMFRYMNNDQFVSYSYLPELIDYEASLFRSARATYIIDQREAIPSLLTYWGGAFKATLPLAQAMRLEGKLAIMNTVRESLESSGTRVNRSDFILAPELRLVLDNSETGYFGPTSGARGFVQVEGVPGLAGLSFARVFADYRQYIPIKNIATIVGRVSIGTNLGSTPQNFLVGGQENLILGRTIGPDILPFNRAEDLYYAQAVMPMRAFAIADGQGRNFFGANLECRIPILSSENTSGFLNSLLNGLQGVVFVDAGSAWTNTLRLNTPRALFDTFDQYVGLADGDLLMSVGVGVRTFLLGQYPVKIDMAWQNLQGGLMLPRVLIGFGYNF